MTRVHRPQGNVHSAAQASPLSAAGARETGTGYSLYGARMAPPSHRAFLSTAGNGHPPSRRPHWRCDDPGLVT